ncbi:hypothetical protein L209DRAFT_528070 [Thermothelomyces heterothallicus CBS 203.75]
MPGHIDSPQLSATVNRIGVLSLGRSAGEPTVPLVLLTVMLHGPTIKIQPEVKLDAASRLLNNLSKSRASSRSLRPGLLLPVLCHYQLNSELLGDFPNPLDLGGTHGYVTQKSLISMVQSKTRERGGLLFRSVQRYDDRKESKETRTVWLLTNMGRTELSWGIASRLLAKESKSGRISLPTEGGGDQNNRCLWKLPWVEHLPGTKVGYLRLDCHCRALAVAA